VHLWSSVRPADLLTHKPGFTIWGAGSIAGHVQHKGWSAWQCVSGGGWVGGFINTCSLFAHEAVACFAALLLCLFCCSAYVWCQQDNPLPWVVGDPRLMNPGIHVGSQLDRLVEGERCIL
jgi:hypothetical protein